MHNPCFLFCLCNIYHSQSRCRTTKSQRVYLPPTSPPVPPSPKSHGDQVVAPGCARSMMDEAATASACSAVRRVPILSNRLSPNLNPTSTITPRRSWPCARTYVAKQRRQHVCVCVRVLCTTPLTTATSMEGVRWPSDRGRRNQTKQQHTGSAVYPIGATICACNCTNQTVAEEQRYANLKKKYWKTTHTHTHTHAEMLGRDHWWSELLLASTDRYGGNRSKGRKVLRARLSSTVCVCVCRDRSHVSQQACLAAWPSGAPLRMPCAEMCELVVHKKGEHLLLLLKKDEKVFDSKWFVLYERFGGKRFQQHDAPYTKCDLRRWHLGVLLGGGRKACIFRSRRSSIVALYQHRGICFSSSSRRGKSEMESKIFVQGLQHTTLRKLIIQAGAVGGIKIAIFARCRRYGAQTRHRTERLRAAPPPSRKWANVENVWSSATVMWYERGEYDTGTVLWFGPERLRPSMNKSNCWWILLIFTDPQFVRFGLITFFFILLEFYWIFLK